jgi:hypothetical protein
VVIGLGVLVASLITSGEPSLEDLQASVGSADQVLLNRAPQIATFSADQLTELEASVGPADQVLRSYVEPGMRGFSQEELAVLQASVGSVDQKWFQN